MKTQLIHPVSALAGATVILGACLLVGMQQPSGTISIKNREILRHMSIVYLPDGLGGTAKTIRFTGVNVQIVNGLEATNGFPFDPDSLDPFLTAVNGVGNLVVGYNELGTPFGDDRRGSHNIVVGHGNSYKSFGGFVGPRDNMTKAPFASVTGGQGNRATGVSSSVSGGLYNTASGHYSWVSGGWLNTASNYTSSVSGGSRNTASGYDSSVSGGRLNTASGWFSSVSGGRNNTASGYYASVSGGNTRSATGWDDWAAGSLFEDN